MKHGGGGELDWGGAGQASSNAVLRRCTRVEEVLGAWLLGAVGLGACQPFTGGDDRLGGDAGAILTAEQGNRVDPWWCLGREQPLKTSDSSQVALRLPLHDQFTQEPPAPGLEGRFCPASDLGCTSPITNWTPVPADGRLTALVPSGFSGYAEVRGPGYPNSLFAVDTPVVRDLELYSHALVPIQGLNAIAQVLMQQVLGPEAGLLIVGALNCDGDAAVNVRITLSSGGTPFVILGGVPVAGRNVTAQDGSIAFNGIPPGPAIVSVVLPDGRSVAERAVDIRGGWYALTFVRPIVYSADELCSDGSTRVVPGRTEAIGRYHPCMPGE